MKTGVLVLGRTGMLGHMVMRILSKSVSVKVCGTHFSDKKDPLYFNAEEGIDRLQAIYKRRRYGYIINCIGITKERIDEDDPVSVLTAIKVNSQFPQELAIFAAKNGIRVIHMSTDAVFSGSRGCYDEDSQTDCADIYGMTKRMGEARSVGFLTIRCSIVGPSPFEKRGLFEWLRSQPERSTVRGYTDQLWNGVTTMQYAELCLKVIRSGLFDLLAEESPVHHFCPNKTLSKYELLRSLKRALRKKIDVIPDKSGLSFSKRTLVTKYRMLKDVFGKNMDIYPAINKMCKTCL